MINQDDVNGLLAAYTKYGALNISADKRYPSRTEIKILQNAIKSLLFPGFFSLFVVETDDLPAHVESQLKTVEALLIDAITRCYQTEPGDPAYITEVATDFVKSLPSLRETLQKDIVACFEGDPASKSHEEVILAYPGFHAILTYRIANFFQRKQIPLIARMMTELTHNETGIDIHPGATIGDYFCIDHGTGVVIGETTIIGDHVKIYQGVTLGGLSVNKNQAEKKRHPTVKDHVTIYSNTSILGGETVIGEHSVVGGNLWIVESIPAYSKVYKTVGDEQVIKARKQRA